MAGNVNHLDTKAFSSTVQAFTKYSNDFETIIIGVEKTANAIIDKWKGKGAEAFKKDLNDITIKLVDVRDILKELCGSLKSAEETYAAADLKVAESFEDEGE